MTLNYASSRLNTSSVTLTYTFYSKTTPDRYSRNCTESPLFTPSSNICPSQQYGPIECDCIPTELSIKYLWSLTTYDQSLKSQVPLSYVTFRSESRIWPKRHGNTLMSKKTTSYLQSLSHPKFPYDDRAALFGKTVIYRIFYLTSVIVLNYGMWFVLLLNVEIKVLPSPQRR